MSAYIFPIKMAMMIFPFLALLISFPLFIREYRKFGAFPAVKGFVLYAFVFYLLTAFFLTMLPLPDKASVAALTTPHYQLQPFANVGRFLNDTVLNITDPSTYIPAMKQGVFLEPVFNIFLTIPFGMFLRFYFRCSLKKTILLSFCLSLFFELTQLSGLYFIYPRPYRLAYVDDLINNTLGGTIGFALAPMMDWILPTRDEMDAISVKQSHLVAPFRRLVALVIDWLVISVVMMLVTLFIPNISQVPTLIILMAQVFIYFVILAKMLGGQTLGKKVVRIKIVDKNDQVPSIWRLTLRYFSLYIIFGILTTLWQQFGTAFSKANTATASGTTIMPLLFWFLFFSVLIIIQVVTLIIPALLKRPGYYEKLSGTHILSTTK